MLTGNGETTLALFVLKPIIWNDRGYKEPAGWPVKGDSYAKDHGFCHEEWNGSDRLKLSSADGEFRVFHTEQAGPKVHDNVGQTFVFMTASNAGKAYLVGVGGNATYLADERKADRRRLTDQLDIRSLGEEAWKLPIVRAKHNDDRAYFMKDVWGSSYDWVANWICPADLFWWLPEPVFLPPRPIRGTAKLLTMYHGVTNLTEGQAAIILEMVPEKLRGPEWERLVAAANVAPGGARRWADLGSLREPITSKLGLQQTRIGQGKFRDELIAHWGGACAVTGVVRPELLRAAHIKPWSRSNGTERQSKDNGLLLSLNLDALFEVGLITFDVDGSMLVSKRLSVQERKDLGLPSPLRLAPSKSQQEFLRHHRKTKFS